LHLEHRELDPTQKQVERGVARDQRAAGTDEVDIAQSGVHGIVDEPLDFRALRDGRRDLLLEIRLDRL
jgi:hypothetical protein